MRRARGFRLIFAALVAANILVWAVPSRVVELVARDHQTLLGRYSFPHFVWAVALSLATAVALYIGRPRDLRARRVRALRILTLSVATFLALVAADIALRFKYPPTYRLDRLAFRRPPNAHWRVSVDDLPQARRSYPVVQPGYPHVDCVFTIDANGYRNSSLLSKYDIVALGDSFTEGSLVSDDQAWPAILARLSGRTVYNLGMSGYSPQHYVASLRAEGLKLAPRHVVCTLFEGNDFRTTETLTDSRFRIKQLFRSSPIVQATVGLLENTLGAIGASRPLPELDVLSWLPVGAPAGENARYYAFAPKDLLDLCIDAEQFQQGRKWQVVSDALSAMASECRGIGSDLTIVYIPTKPHVVLPLIAGRLPAPKVRAFVALGTSMKLPEASVFLHELQQRIDQRESLVADWCRTHSVRFLSLTPPLRQAASQGRQPYYTYDQHWTPVGHEITARVINEAIAWD